MKISELTALLSRVTSVAGDVDVTLATASGEQDTAITDATIHLDPSSGDVTGSLVLTIGQAPPASSTAEQTLAQGADQQPPAEGDQPAA